VLELFVSRYEIQLPIERRRDAYDLSERFTGEGYVSSARSEFPGRYGTADTMTVVVVGDVSEDDVRSIVEHTTDAEYTLSRERYETGAFRTIDGYWRWPWDPTRIEQRVAHLREYAARTGLETPLVDARGTRVVVDAGTAGGVATARRLLRPAAALSARLVDADSGERYAERARFDNVTPRRGYPVSTTTVALEGRDDGYLCSFQSDPPELYAEQLFRYNGTSLPRPEDVRLEFRLDGEHLLTRDLTVDEVARLHWYHEETGDGELGDQNDPPEPHPAVEVGGRSRETAVKMAAGIRAPTGTVNAFREIC